MDIHYGLELLIVILGALFAWWLNHRDAQREELRQAAEKERERKTQELKEWKATIEVRMSKLEDDSKERFEKMDTRVHEQDLEIHDRPSRKELSDSVDKVFAKIDTMELKFDALKTLVVEAISNGRRTNT